MNPYDPQPLLNEIDAINAIYDVDEHVTLSIEYIGQGKYHSLLIDIIANEECPVNAKLNLYIDSNYLCKSEIEEVFILSSILVSINNTNFIAPDTKSLREIEKLIKSYNINYSGHECLFDFVEEFRTILLIYFERNAESHIDGESEDLGDIDNTTNNTIENNIEIPYYSGEEFIDRKSVFQAHLCRNIHSMEDVDRFHHEIMRNKRIARATHNIMAYRFLKNNTISSSTDLKNNQTPSTDFVHGYDSDGEDGAGYKLRELLRLSNCCNVMVIVSRWYGGVKLGPDRFRHINNCARVLLRQHGCL